MHQFNFIGTRLQPMNYGEFRLFVENWFYNNLTIHIAVVNAYCAVLARKNSALAEIYKNAELVVPDGMPFVFWMNLFGNKKVHQFDATNVLLKLIEYSKKLKFSFYFYGGSPTVLNKMTENLKNKFQHINIAGSYSPPFRELSEEEKNWILEDIRASGARVICVGLGTPKQDNWIREHKSEFPGSLFIPCGAIFDFFGGRIKKAPSFISKIGFEWLYRLFSKDFKRLFYRYTFCNIYFMIHFFLQITRLKRY
jgi:N-acetylglucosaminyldiphosphoundecaprenol N-acetyl-beta-D-mannosaminyltransferase